MGELIRVAIIEDQELFREGLVSLIESRPELELDLAATSVEGYLGHEQHEAPQVILLDIGLPGGMSGLEGIRPLKRKYGDAEIIMLTTFDDSERIFKALCAGASAYLTKRTPFPRIVEAITTVHRGGSYMSPAIARKVVNHFSPTKQSTASLTGRQSQIVDAMMEGLSYKMIADKLLISEATVKDHIKKIYRKLQINSKGELMSLKLRGELD